MNLHQGLKYLLCFILGLSVTSQALAATEENPPLVEVHIPQDNLAPYKDRRLDSGIYVAVGYEALLLNKFTSGIDGISYDTVYGSNPIPLVRFNMDYKYNIALGSLSAGVEFGYGKNTGDDAGGERSLSVTKYGLDARYAADMIWDEPYVVPYVGITVWQMQLDEKTATDTLSESTGFGYNYTVGLMFQLNWIDYATARNATFNLGLENTFIDVYLTQYSASGSAGEPETETDLIYGANLRFEF
ncbi:hypothetical protein D3C87_87330 [compost metagenome]